MPKDLHYITVGDIAELVLKNAILNAGGTLHVSIMGGDMEEYDIKFRDVSAAEEFTTFELTLVQLVQKKEQQ